VCICCIWCIIVSISVTEGAHAEQGADGEIQKQRRREKG
jgi:hypothetical protein